MYYKLIYLPLLDVKKLHLLLYIQGYLWISLPLEKEKTHNYKPKKPKGSFSSKTANISKVYGKERKK